MNGTQNVMKIQHNFLVREDVALEHTKVLYNEKDMRKYFNSFSYDVMYFAVVLYIH